MDITIGKFKLRLTPGSDIHWSNRYFILKFKNGRYYVGWTGPLGTGLAKEKISAFLRSNTSAAPSAKKIRQDSDIKSAILESDYIEVTTVNIQDLNNSRAVYEGLYGLIDRYKAYMPYGYNKIDALGKSLAEKEVIRKYAKKWDIRPCIPRAYKSRDSRPVYQYAAMPHQLYITRFSFVKKWDSISAFVKANNLGEYFISKIYRCCNKKERTVRGFVFRFSYEGQIIELEPDKRQTRQSKPSKPSKSSESSEQKGVEIYSDELM